MATWVLAAGVWTSTISLPIHDCFFTHREKNKWVQRKRVKKTELSKTKGGERRGGSGTHSRSVDLDDSLRPHDRRGVHKVPQGRPQLRRSVDESNARGGAGLRLACDGHEGGGIVLICCLP